MLWRLDADATSDFVSISLLICRSHCREGAQRIVTDAHFRFSLNFLESRACVKASAAAI